MYFKGNAPVVVNWQVLLYWFSLSAVANVGLAFCFGRQVKENVSTGLPLRGHFTYVNNLCLILYCLSLKNMDLVTAKHRLCVLLPKVNTWYNLLTVRFYLQL